jgi:hypothetical protein
MCHHLFATPADGSYADCLSPPSVLAFLTRSYSTPATDHPPIWRRYLTVLVPPLDELSPPPILSLFAWLIGHQPAVLYSQNKSATSNQTAVLFSQNKPAPATSHQPNEQALPPLPLLINNLGAPRFFPGADELAARSNKNE